MGPGTAEHRCALHRVRDTSYAISRLFPFDDVSQDDIGQLDHKLPKPGILLDERHPLDVVLIPGRIFANRRRAGALLPIGRWIRVPHH